MSPADVVRTLDSLYRVTLKEHDRAPPDERRMWVALSAPIIDPQTPKVLSTLR